MISVCILTRHRSQLLKSCPSPYLAVHPSDAAQLGLVSGDWAEVGAPGRQPARYAVRVTDDVPPGTAFVPFHWGAHRHAGGSVNTLLDSAVDPASGQPGLKFAAVAIRACQSDPALARAETTFPGGNAHDLD